MGVARWGAMRSAGPLSRVSRLLLILGVLCLLLPGAASAGQKVQTRKAKNKTSEQTKRSKQKMALQRSKAGGKKGTAKAAGFLPRPGAKPAGETTGAAKLAGTRTASVSKTTTRARTAKARRPIARKTKTAKKSKKMTPAKRRAARTTRSKSRSSQQFDTDAAAELGADGPEGRMGERQMGPMEMGGDMEMGAQKPQSRFRRFLGATGRALKKTAKFAGYAAVVAAPMVVMAAGGLPLAFAIGAPAIFLGIPLAIGLVEQRARQNQGGIDDPQNEMLQRYMTRQMLENQDLNGPGPGNGVAGAGGLNTLGNMINPGGIGGRQMP